jgi:hypothetical protein
MDMKKKTYLNYKKTQLGQDKEADRVIIQISDHRQQVNSKLFQWKENLSLILINYHIKSTPKLNKIFYRMPKAQTPFKSLKIKSYHQLRTRYNLNLTKITRSYRLSLICLNIK